jgi:drug/metabolite transporter (DMT)-like permease
MKGYLFVMGAAFVYASQVILGKFILTEGISVWTLSLMQVVICTLVMFPFAAMKAPEGFAAKFKIQRRDIPWMLLAGLSGGFGANLALYGALSEVDAGIGSMLLFLNPVVVCLFFLVTGIRRLTKLNVAALFAVLLGSALVLNIFGAGKAWTPLGIFLGLLSCFSVAIFFLVLDLKLAKYPITVIYFYDWLLASALMLLIRPGAVESAFQLSPRMVLLVVVISTVTTVLPSFLLGKGIILVGSERATVVATLELPLTVLMAYLFLSEVMVPAQLVGVALVVGAVIALSIEGSRGKPLRRNPEKE